jgi:hypothetical protein
MKRFVVLWLVATAAFLGACAGERQGLVCDEMEYRLNTMTYSPDQRAFAEEELRACREQEADKKAAGAAQRQSIYDKFAASGSEKESGKAEEVSVSKALKDSSGVETESIYDRYKSVNDAEPAADTASADEGSFQ